MSLATVEKKVDGLCKDVKEIRTSIIGGLNGKPGLQDKIRDLEKRHKYLFLISGVALLGMFWLSANGSLSSLAKFIIGLIT